MKNIVMMMTSAAVGVLIVISIMAVMGRVNHAVEIQSQLSSITEMTVSNAMAKENAGKIQKEEYLADAVQQLAMTLETKADVEIKVAGAEPEKGVLGLKITEYFKHPNERVGTVNSSRTVIYNQPALPEETKICEVTFFLSREEMQQNKNYYKKLSLCQGDAAFTPTQPQNAGKAFVAWVDCNGYIADFSQPVTEDLVYYAEWN